MSGRDGTPEAARNAVGVLALQAARPAMSVLLRPMNEVSRRARINHVEDVGRRAGRAREGGLTAEPLQRQEGCEKGGGKPERFGLSFRLALVTTDLLQQG